MTLEFLFFADLILLLRFRLLLTDEPLVPARWWRKCVAEVILLLLLVPISASSVIAAVTSIVMAFTTILWMRRARDRNAVQLFLGVVHLVILSVCFSHAFGASFRPSIGMTAVDVREVSALGAAFALILNASALKLVFGLLLAGNEANLLIRWLLGRLQLKPGGNVAPAIDAREYARGRVIGLLERALIYCFVLSGQYGAVGFTLAAKGFTRFKELDNRSFAEYVLIGTLLSSGLSMLIAVGVRYL